jgi:hypothetical protein
MLGRGEPPADDLRELLRGHARVRGGHQLRDAGLALCQGSFQVAVQQRSKRLLGPPLGVLGRQRFDAIDDEEELEIHRLFGPQAAVVVEHGDPLGRRNEVGRTLARRPADEIEDHRFGRPFVPRRQRITAGRGLGPGRRRQEGKRQRAERNELSGRTEQRSHK